MPRPAGGARAARNELPERVDGLKVVGVETLREALAAALAPPAGPSGEVRQARVPVLDRTGSPASG